MKAVLLMLDLGFIRVIKACLPIEIQKLEKSGVMIYHLSRNFAGFLRTRLFG